MKKKETTACPVCSNIAIIKNFSNHYIICCSNCKIETIRFSPFNEFIMEDL